MIRYLLREQNWNGSFLHLGTEREDGSARAQPLRFYRDFASG